MLASVTLALMVAGFVLVNTRVDAFSAIAAATAGPNLEIRDASRGVWGQTTGPAWTLTNAAPGDSVTGTVWLRTLEAVMEGTGLVLRADAPAATQGFAAHLFITLMSLGGSDLLGYWGGCTGGGKVTLEILATCPEQDARLPVPGTGGEDIVMTIQVDPALGNAFQGASMGGLTFEFALWSPDDSGVGRAGDGRAVAGSASTGGPGSAVPHGVPASSVTPQPPRTGYGVFPEERPHLAGYALIGLGAFAGALQLISLAAASRRRRAR
jgi:hypothetical protein